MPKTSFRQRELSKLRKHLSRRLAWRKERSDFGVVIELEDQLDAMLLSYFNYINSRRSLADRTLQIRASSRLEHYLLFMAPDQFKTYFRLSRPFFFAVVVVIKNTDVFRRLDVNGKLHLLVTLKFFGTSGNGATPNKLGELFPVSPGTVPLYVQRTVDALLGIRGNVIAWPNEEQRRNLAIRIRAKWRFPNCVGFIVGTLLPLEFKPTLCGEDYFSRKMNYAVSCVVVCGDKGRILYLNTGWVDSTHANRVWENSQLFLNRDCNFKAKEYLLGDTAYTPSAVMVPAFKRPQNASLPSQQEWFNSHLAKARIKAERAHDWDAKRALSVVEENPNRIMESKAREVAIHEKTQLLLARKQLQDASVSQHEIDQMLPL